MVSDGFLWRWGWTFGMGGGDRNSFADSSLWGHILYHWEILCRFHSFYRLRRPLGWVEYSSTLSRTSAVDGGGGSAPRPGRLLRYTNLRKTNIFTAFTFAIIDGATRVGLPCFPFWTLPVIKFWHIKYRISKHIKGWSDQQLKPGCIH